MLGRGQGLGPWTGMEVAVLSGVQDLLTWVIRHQDPSAVGHVGILVAFSFQFYSSVQCFLFVLFCV